MDVSRLVTTTSQVQDKSVPDDVVAEKIIARLKQTSVVVSYAEIARSARAEGRNLLAAQVCFELCFTLLFLVTW